MSGFLKLSNEFHSLNVRVAGMVRVVMRSNTLDYNGPVSHINKVNDWALHHFDGAVTVEFAALIWYSRTASFTCSCVGAAGAF